MVRKRTSDGEVDGGPRRIPAIYVVVGGDVRFDGCGYDGGDSGDSAGWDQEKNERVCVRVCVLELV